MAHVEDVVTRQGYESQGIGKALIKRAVDFAKENGCYKVILNCNEGNVGFYEKQGFKRHDIGMRLDLLPTPTL